MHLATSNPQEDAPDNQKASNAVSHNQTLKHAELQRYGEDLSATSNGYI